jgi:hypothetical protein
LASKSGAQKKLAAVGSVRSGIGKKGMVLNDVTPVIGRPLKPMRAASMGSG